MKRETPLGNDYIENLLESKEFQIYQGNHAFLILLGKTINSVTVKCSHYSANLNYNELSIITGNKFNNINELYNFIFNIFNNNNVQIEIKNNEMNLNLSFYNMNTKQNKKFMITMAYSNNNIDYFINNLWNKITKLEQENEILKMNFQNLMQSNQQLYQEIQSLKNSNNFNNNINNMINNNMNNIHSSFNQSMNDGNNYISILFKEQGGGNMLKTLHNCNINDTIANLMDRYREKINNRNYKFYLTFNAKVLEPRKTLKQVGLTNSTTLNVVKGDPPVYFN